MTRHSIENLSVNALSNGFSVFPACLLVSPGGWAGGVEGGKFEGVSLGHGTDLAFI